MTPYKWIFRGGSPSHLTLEMAVKCDRLPSFSFRESIACSGEHLPKNKNKKGIRGGKVLNLISFKLEALRGKLILISHHFQRRITPSPTPGNVFLTAKRRSENAVSPVPTDPFHSSDILHLLHLTVVEWPQVANSITYFSFILMKLLRDDEALVSLYIDA